MRVSIASLEKCALADYKFLLRSRPFYGKRILGSGIQAFLGRDMSALLKHFTKGGNLWIEEIF